MFGTSTSFIKVWDIEDTGKSADVKISVNRTLKDNDYDNSLVKNGVSKDGKHITAYSGFARFIGHAYNQLKEYGVQKGDTITNVTFSLKQEPYFDEKNGVIAYPKNAALKISSFELANNENTSNSPMDTPPAVEEEEFSDDATIDEDDMPF